MANSNHMTVSCFTAQQNGEWHQGGSSLVIIKSVCEYVKTISCLGGVRFV